MQCNAIMRIGNWHVLAKTGVEGVSCEMESSGVLQIVSCKFNGMHKLFVCGSKLERDFGMSRHFSINGKIKLK